MKKRLTGILLGIGAVAMVAAVLLWRSEGKEGESGFVVSLPIRDITEKIQDGEYYLTVLLEEDVVEEYGLSDDSLTLETVESIFNQVTANSGFVGMTLDVTIPEGATEKEIGVILKEGRGEYCRIVGVTTDTNEMIR